MPGWLTLADKSRRYRILAAGLFVAIGLLIGIGYVVDISSPTQSPFDDPDAVRYVDAESETDDETTPRESPPLPANNDQPTADRRDDPQQPPLDDGDSRQHNVRQQTDRNDADYTDDGLQGPRRWMAEPNDVDIEQLERRFHEAEEKRNLELAIRDDRFRSIDAAHHIIAGCSERHELRGPLDSGVAPRIAIQWTLQTDDGEGTIQHPQFLHRIGVHSPSFEQCVVDELGELTFGADSDQVELEVRSVFRLSD